MTIKTFEGEIILEVSEKIARGFSEGFPPILREVCVNAEGEAKEVLFILPLDVFPYPKYI